MKPWIKICLIFNAIYLTTATLVYLLSKSKVSFLVVLLIGVPFKLILFLKYRKKPERIPARGEIVRLKNPIVELYEKIKNKMEVKK